MSGNAGRAAPLAVTLVAAFAFAGFGAADDEVAGGRLGTNNDYPTVDRVEYVQECMRRHPGARYEMLYKCSCVLDRIAARIPYEQYVELWTAANAMSIGGERGNYLRDAEAARDMATKFLSVERVAQQQCFLRRDE